jgi:four helix bundle protein
MSGFSKKTDLERRTKLFAIDLIQFVSSLPRSNINDILSYQLLKAGTSIGANYREANRAESKNDFKHKIGIVQKEAAETQYWLEIMNETNLFDKAKVLPLLKESSELLAIFTSIGKKLKVESRISTF